MTKTTKKYVTSISDTVQFQERNTIKDVEITGVTHLADVEKNGNLLTLKLNSDKTKANVKDVYTKDEVTKMLQNLKTEILEELRG